MVKYHFISFFSTKNTFILIFLQKILLFFQWTHFEYAFSRSAGQKGPGTWEPEEVEFIPRSPTSNKACVKTSLLLTVGNRSSTITSFHSPHHHIRNLQKYKLIQFQAISIVITLLIVLQKSRECCKRGNVWFDKIYTRMQEKYERICIVRRIFHNLGVL